MTKTKAIQPETVEVEDVRKSAPSPSKQQLIAYKPEFLDGLLNYLGSKPFNEVVGFINGIQQGQPVEV